MSVNLDLKNGESLTGTANPLCIPEITEHMFQFLKLSDIKNCRSVCQKWNQLAEQFVKKLSVVNILKSERIEEFNQVFPNAQQCQIFTCFRFGHMFDGFGCEWPVYQFGDFCEKLHHNLSELTLFGPDFGLNEGKETYDLTPLLPATLIKLRIESSKSIMIISTDKISNIRILELKGCILNILPGTTLNNVEIVLEKLKFRDGNENIEEFLINPLLNFDVMKNASFGGKNIILDCDGSHTLDMLSLDDGVTLLNWETSNWVIEKLCFSISFFNKGQYGLTKSQVKYKELKSYLTHLDVSLLPEGIEKLEVYLLCTSFFQESPPLIYGVHNFLDLKYLKLHITSYSGSDFSPLMEIFQHCPKLTILTTLFATISTLIDTGEFILKTSSISTSVKTLHVNYNVRIIVDKSLHLESLLLQNPHRDGKYKVIVELMKELHAKNLYWFEDKLEKGLESLEGDENISDNEKGINFKSLIDLNLENFVVGRFPQVNNSEFEKSFLFPLVDEQGKYYIFARGKKGKAISQSDAMQLSRR